MLMITIMMMTARVGGQKVQCTLISIKTHTGVYMIFLWDVLRPMKTYLDVMMHIILGISKNKTDLLLHTDNR